jgi:predicted Zn-dependent protease with MMP-like domain
MPYRVSKDEFEVLVESALNELPEPFSELLEEVAIEIRDRPTPAQLRQTGVSHGGLLLGLYHGRPRTRRGVEDSGTMPDVIYIFQDHLQAIAGNRDDLVKQVRVTVLHEIGHHFGMSEEDLDRLGYG